MHVARVVLRVSEVARTARFYERVAGLVALAQDTETAALGAPNGGPVLLELRRALRPGRAPRQAAGLFHTALRYPTRAALAQALRRLAELRQPLTGASDHGVSEALYLDDPDGLGVELYRDRPRDQWPPPQPGDRVGMFTVALDLEDLLAAAPVGAGADETAAGIDVGHVHLKVRNVEEAVDFWTGQVGLDLTVRYGADAAFLADGEYHHHIGVNTWISRGAPLEPADGPGLDAVVLAGTEQRSLRTPDGVAVVVEPGALP